MRILELIAEGDTGPFDVFPGHLKRNERRVFGYWEVGSLLDGLARCPAPAVAGLDEGPFNEAMHRNRDRHQRYKRSMLSLTALGEAILARSEDFSRHNPIHRWWGGTELVNDTPVALGPGEPGLGRASTRLPARPIRNAEFCRRQLELGVESFGSLDWRNVFLSHGCGLPGSGPRTRPENSRCADSPRCAIAHLRFALSRAPECDQITASDHSAACA